MGTRKMAPLLGEGPEMQAIQMSKHSEEQNRQVLLTRLCSRAVF